MKELIVTYEGLGEKLTLGTLADDGRNVLFEYSRDAIDRGLELSPFNLRLRGPAYPDRQGDYRALQDVPGLVFDSLPDSWGRLLMDRRMRALGIEARSTLDRLAYLGSNTMGALTYSPAQLDDLSDRDMSIQMLAAEVQALIEDDSHQVVAELARAGASPGGARPKALMYLNTEKEYASNHPSSRPDLPTEPWLVKFRGRHDAADACVLELLYAQLAYLCGLDMSDTRLFLLPQDQYAFATKRFDRMAGQRVHTHSLAGLLHADFNYPTVTYEHLFQLTKKLTMDQREVVKAVKQCIFNILVNNKDDHSKNFAFVMHGDGWHLAPPYDLTYCLGERNQHWMSVSNEGLAPGRQHVVNAAKSGGLPEKLVLQLIDEITERLSPAVFYEQARKLPLLRATVAEVGAAITLNHQRLTTT